MKKIYYSAQARLIFGILGTIILTICAAMISLLVGVPQSWHVPQIAACVILVLVPFLVRWTKRIV
jgi:hypothetical protein